MPHDNTTFGVLAFRFGPETSEPVPQPWKEFYRGVVSSVVDAPIRAIEREPLTLAQSMSELAGQSTNDRVEGGSLVERMLSRGRSWGEEPDVILVDAMFGRHRVQPGRALLQLVAGLHSLIGYFPNTTLVLLLDAMPPEGDPVRRIVQPILDSGRLTVIDRLCRMLPASMPPDELTECYVQLEARKDEIALERLSRKMIRRLGHFQRTLKRSGQVECVRYFYDGRRSTNETARLLVRHVSASPGGELPALLFDCTVSTWLKGAVSEAAAVLGMQSPPVDVRELLEKGGGSGVSDANLLILPLLDTGDTLRELYNQWRAVIPEVPFPKVLSVLVTHGANRVLDTANRVFSEPIPGGELEVSYLLEVERGLQREAPCPMCSIGLPVYEGHADHFEMLCALDFWEMVDESGWKPEDYVPVGTRESLGWVPDFSRMLQYNGAWLAEKALVRVANELRISRDTEPIVLVAPDELGARTFAEYMAEMYDTAAVILVPADTIRLLRTGSDSEIDGATAEWKANRPVWFEQMRELLFGGTIVMVQEFSQSGASARALRRLVRVFRHSVMAHALICDMGPSHFIPGEPPRLALYEFDLRPERNSAFWAAGW